MRPGTSLSRRLAVTALGVVAGIAAGLASITLAAADRLETAYPAVFDATHLPPLLTISGERAELAYDVHCAPGDEDAEAGCEVNGTVFVRSAGRAFVRTTSARDSHERGQSPARRAPSGRGRRAAGRIRVLRRDRGTCARPTAHRSRRRCGCATCFSSAGAPGAGRARATRIRQPPTSRNTDCVRVMGRRRHAGRTRTRTRARGDRCVVVRRRRCRDAHRARSGASPTPPVARGRDMRRPALPLSIAGTIADIALGERRNARTFSNPPPSPDEMHWSSGSTTAVVSSRRSRRRSGRRPRSVWRRKGRSCSRTRPITGCR